jgi:Tfp pilus assembly protein PilX
MTSRTITNIPALPGRKRLARRGFALVITLSLMILLTMLAVGLLTLSTVALRTSSQGSAVALARSNARLALIIALGELQKAAGQDQRVTAAADFAGGAGGTRLKAGAAPANGKSLNGIANDLSPLQPGTRYWTGVWNTVTADAPASQIYTKTPSATGVQWLISGNELKHSTPQAFTPATPNVALKSDGTVSDKTQTVVLVGASSVGCPTPVTIDNFVSAPLVDITVTDRLGKDAPGRYAWWIGDEGVKARINRAAPTPASQPATYQTLASQRAGWEVVSQLTNYPTPQAANHALLDRVATLPEAILVDASLVPFAGDPVALFHTATADSFGVLADSLQGGLRLDLTAYLKRGLPTSAQTTFPNEPKQNANIIPKSVAPNIQGPKWNALKAFYTQSTSLSQGKLTVKAAAKGSELTIAPIIVDLRLLMGVKIDPINADSYKLNPCAKIAISLANPYPYPLEWKTNLELEIIDETPFQTEHSSRIWDAEGRSRYLGRKTAPGTFDKPDEAGVLHNAVFVIPKGELNPGEAAAFTNGSAIVRPANDVSQIKVDLSPFSTCSPADFTNCVQLIDNTANSGGKKLDVRESWTTSQPTAELRLAGGSASAAVLRRIERFELDNAFYSDVRRDIDNNTAASMTSPFPLHLYSFQLSQPGADYAALLPSADLLGTRNSTLRTFTDFNLQAVRFGKLITSYNPPPYFMESTDSLASLPFNPPGGETGTGFTRNLAITPLAWGRSPVGKTKKTILFTFPKSFISLAQLQHADLTADDQAVGISQQPGNAVGNSYASSFVKRKNIMQSRDNYIVTGGHPTSTKTTVNFYDIAYLLNATLWDTFYFSSIGENSSQGPLNRSMTILNQAVGSASMNDPVQAASHLLVAGSFNVNSTSKDAWKALLAGNRFLKHPADSASTSTGNALFPRSLEQRRPSTDPPSGTDDDSFAGYRRLTPQQIDTVAGEIVKQVRLRGPFVSLSHFVNRALLDLSSDSSVAAPMSRCGALQSALDNGGVNISPDGKKSGFSANLVIEDDKVKFQLDQNAPKADMWGDRGNGDYTGTTEDGFPVWAPQSKDLNPGACASILAERTMLTDSTLTQEQGFRSTGIPGWITQADVLQVIGPSLATRSDTFRIRAYGEALSPDGKTVLAKAWCESIVQRVPQYTDPSNAAVVRPADLSELNKLFGRRFEIVSFRWLSENEI